MITINRVNSCSTNNSMYQHKQKSRFSNVCFGTNVVSVVDRIAKSTNAKQNAITSLQDFVNLVREDKLKRLCNRILQDTDDSFFVVPSSTGGKFHDRDETKIGGLVLHLKRVVVTALSAMRRYGYEYGLEKSPSELKFIDSAITASMLHDCPYRMKKENGKYFMDPDHAAKNAKHIEKTMRDMDFDEESIELISAGVGFHMGVWDKHSDNAWLERFKQFKTNPFVQTVQEADYYSTRKNMRVDYDLNNLDIRKSFIK